MFIDVNECATNNGGCNHLCINAPGTATCGCNAGFFLAVDGVTCTSKDRVPLNLILHFFNSI